MNILIGMRYANPPAGGAEKSMLLLSKLLNNDGHNVKIISLGYSNKKYFVGDIPVEEINFRGKIKNKSLVMREIEKYNLLRKNDFGIFEKIKKFNPDLIITQHEISFLFFRYKKFLPKIILFIHGMEFFPNLRNKLTKPNITERFYSLFCGKFLQDKLREIISSANYVFFPSDFLKEKYSQFFKGNLQVIPPFVGLNKNSFSSKREYILHVKPTKTKGIKRTLQIAKKMSSERFLICGENIENIKFNLPNVKYIGYRKNMDELYSISKILLIPTTQPETFSISAVEAQWGGCNVLILQKGGIPTRKESFLKKGNLNEWVKAIKIGGYRLDKQELSKYSANENFKKFKSIIKI